MWNIIIGYSSIASSSFCVVPLPMIVAWFLLEMHRQFWGTRTPAGQPHSQEGAVGASKHSGSFSAFVRRLRPGFQGQPCSVLCTEMAGTGLLSTFSELSRFPTHSAPLHLLLQLAELPSCSTQLSTWQRRLGINVPVAFLACSSQSKSRKKKKSKNRKITITRCVDPRPDWCFASRFPWQPSFPTPLAPRSWCKT